MTGTIRDLLIESFDPRELRTLARFGLGQEEPGIDAADALIAASDRHGLLDRLRIAAQLRRMSRDELDRLEGQLRLNEFALSASGLVQADAPGLGLFTEVYHLMYLARLQKTDVVPQAIAERAWMVWMLAREKVGEGLRVPAAVAHDGGPIHYTWDADASQVTVEIPATGPCDWFTREKSTDAYDGGEFDPLDGLPQPVIAALTRLAASHW